MSDSTKKHALEKRIRNNEEISEEETEFIFQTYKPFLERKGVSKDVIVNRGGKTTMEAVDVGWSTCPECGYTVDDFGNIIPPETYTIDEETDTQIPPEREAGL